MNSCGGSEQSFCGAAWRRSVAMLSNAGESTEEWSDGRVQLRVSVKTGKPIDVGTLREVNVDDIRAANADLDDAIYELFSATQDLEVLTHCPICSETIGRSRVLLARGFAKYVTCGNCGHGFVNPRPSLARMNRRFRESADLAETYADDAMIDFRLREVVGPKLDWVAEQYLLQRGRQLHRLSDVGAGGGHFVYAARERGMSVQGYEISEVSAKFAKSRFGVELASADFLTDDRAESLDAVTMWGLLEYVSNPLDFLRAARARMHKDTGMLFLEVPNVDSISTGSQSFSEAVIARHMDPTSHLHCFSRLSTLCALLRTGFEPTAVWYFGMDAQEFAVQVVATTAPCADGGSVSRLSTTVQSYIDSGQLGDSMVFAAVAT